MTRPAWVLLDRDGTINVKAPGRDYVTDPADLELLPGAAAAIRRLNEKSLPIAVVTNQRGIALGRMSEDDLARVHERMTQELARAGASVQLILHCPHEHGACECRKPRPGMLVEAARRLGASLESSVTIGDSERDVLAGKVAGTWTVRIGDGAETSADMTASSLAAAVDALLDLPPLS